MYTVRDVCAVIISYNDILAIQNNIGSILQQSDRVLIIDNASDNKCVSKLKELEESGSIEVIYDNKNRGIAFQLNRALEYCREKGYRLLLTMDQDTLLMPYCVREMLDVLNSKNDIGSIGPNREYPKWKERSSFRTTNYLITSGSIVDVDKAIMAGGYCNELFIDMVDIDFSLALRCAGYRVGIATRARMMHQVGNMEQNKFLCFHVKYLSHTPMRFYYIYRNRQIVCKKYFNQMPRYCIKMWVSLFLNSFSIIKEKNFYRKMKMALRGTREGLLYNRSKVDKNEN